MPEPARQARDALRETLVRLGGAAVQGGVYACANAWEPYVEAEADRLGVRGRLTLLTSTDLRIGGESDPIALARRLWPLDELADGHRRLAAVARARLARLTAATSPGLPGRTERLAITVELAAEFTRATTLDPLLPPELLPRPWPGAEARALTADCWRLLLHAERSDPAPGPRLFHRYDEVVREITGAGGEAGGEAGRGAG